MHGCLLIVASVHEDVIRWLNPDWVLFNRTGSMSAPVAAGKPSMNKYTSEHVLRANGTVDKSNVHELFKPLSRTLTLKAFGKRRYDATCLEEVRC